MALVVGASKSGSSSYFSLLTFLFLGGGQSRARGGLLVLYMVSSLSAMDRVVEQEVSELGEVLKRDLGSLSISVMSLIDNQNKRGLSHVAEICYRGLHYSRSS